MPAPSDARSWHQRWQQWRRRDHDTRALGERALAQGRRDAGWLTRIAYGFRLAWHRQAHRRLIDSLLAPGAPTAWAEMLQANPLLGFKILHPCHQAGLTAEQRVDRVLAHHQAMHRLLGPLGYRATQVDRQGALLATLPWPGDARPCTLRLSRHARFWREGELTLALQEPDGALLYTLTFSVRQPPEAPEASLLIGSLIGMAGNDQVKRLTKQCHGLRPQALMVAAAQHLAARLELTQIEAVGRAGHVFARSDRADRLQFDYDSFWQELGAEAQDARGQLWRLPLRSPRRPETDIPAHKRAQYRRRYQWLDTVAAAIDAGLVELRSSGPAPGSG